MLGEGESAANKTEFGGAAEPRWRWYETSLLSRFESEHGNKEKVEESLKQLAHREELDVRRYMGFVWPVTVK